MPSHFLAERLVLERQWLVEVFAAPLVEGSGGCVEPVLCGPESYRVVALAGHAPMEGEAEEVEAAWAWAFGVIISPGSSRPVEAYEVRLVGVQSQAEPSELRQTTSARRGLGAGSRISASCRTTCSASGFDPRRSFMSAKSPAFTEPLILPRVCWETHWLISPLAFAACWNCTAWSDAGKASCTFWT